MLLRIFFVFVVCSLVPFSDIFACPSGQTCPAGKDCIADSSQCVASSSSSSGSSSEPTTAKDQLGLTFTPGESSDWPRLAGSLKPDFFVQSQEATTTTKGLFEFTATDVQNAPIPVLESGK